MSLFCQCNSWFSSFFTKLNINAFSFHNLTSHIQCMYNKRKRILSICTTRDSQTISFNTIFNRVCLGISICFSIHSQESIIQFIRIFSINFQCTSLTWFNTVIGGIILLVNIERPRIYRFRFLYNQWGFISRTYFITCYQCQSRTFPIYFTVCFYDFISNCFNRERNLVQAICWNSSSSVQTFVCNRST